MQDEDESAKADDSLPALDVAAQVDVPFLDELLLAVQGVDGDIYVPVTPFAQRLGMAQPRQQVLRIRRDETMEEALRMMPIKTTGGIQDMQCLRIDMLTLWLATIRAAAVKEAVRPRLRQYKREAARAILAYFTAKVQHQQVAAIGSTDPRMANLTALAEQYDVLMAAASFIAEHMHDLANLAAMPDQLSQALQLLESLAGDVQQLKQEKTITPGQKLHISDAVQRIVTDSMGKPGEMKQGQVYAALYRRFQVSGYAEIPAARYDEVIAYLRDLWKRATAGTTPEQKSLF